MLKFKIESNIDQIENKIIKHQMDIKTLPAVFQATLIPVIKQYIKDEIPKNLQSLIIINEGRDILWDNKSDELISIPVLNMTISTHMPEEYHDRVRTFVKKVQDYIENEIAMLTLGGF